MVISPDLNINDYIACDLPLKFHPAAFDPRRTSYSDVLLAAQLLQDEIDKYAQA